MRNAVRVEVDSRIHSTNIMTGNRLNGFLGYDLSIIVQIKNNRISMSGRWYVGDPTMAQRLLWSVGVYSRLVSRFRRI